MVKEEKKMKKGFTLIEVVVAVGLLAMVIAFSSVIFKVSIETRRTAGANAEIMQKLRAITNQLNRDFAGLCDSNAPLMIWFEQRAIDDTNRYDQIMFFADSDFQSTQLYLKTAPKVPSLTGTDIVVGNIARIYYGQASLWRTSTGTWFFPWEQWGDTEQEKILNKRARTLARRTHILTADSDLQPFPLVSGSNITSFTPTGNDSNEHDSISLSQWKAITNDPVNPANNDVIIATCFGNTSTNESGRPQIDFVSQPPVGLHMLMTEGVGSFAVQWAYWGSTLNVPVLRWFPSNDPNGDLSATSDFALMGAGVVQFGSYFNLQPPPTIAGWHPIGIIESNVQKIFLKTDAGLPKALKFTFRIYDSKGIIKDGRTFTHIVYLER
jgi:prepilin-type N-terminal cleavage/methylation domain-containing protein